jgi:hypothetical protein
VTAVPAARAETRPFYGEFAWAYDYLVARPVAGECAGMVAMLARRGVGAGSVLLVVFRSETRLDPRTRRMLVAERHTLRTESGEITSAFDFVMQCWARDELEARLRPAGFEGVEYADTYEGMPAGAGDRIVAAASRGAW